MSVVFSVDRRSDWRRLSISAGGGALPPAGWAGAGSADADNTAAMKPRPRCSLKVRDEIRDGLGWSMTVRSMLNGTRYILLAIAQRSNHCVILRLIDSYRTVA